MHRQSARRLAGALGAVAVVVCTNARAAQNPPPSGPPPVALPGDAARGQVLVQSSRCLTCHRIDDDGSRSGPDLSNVGAIRLPEQLERALVAPDEEVQPDHRSVRLVMKDGTTVQGRLLNQDAFSIQVLSDKEQLKSYPRSSVREHTILVKGLMPSYEGKLNAAQIADVVAYLASRKGPRP